MKEKIEELKQTILEEVKEYEKENPEDVYLENFYSDSFVQFENENNLELMFWIEDDQVFIQSV